jgi:gas vesicle protein
MADDHEGEVQRGVGLLIAGFAIGALVGSVVGLLFAPKSGKELREDIKDKSAEYYGKAKETAAKTYEATKEKVGTYYDAAKDYLDEKVSGIKGAVETGIRTAKERIKKTGESVEEESEEKA